jgi:hypothetical protein
MNAKWLDSLKLTSSLFALLSGLAILVKKTTINVDIDAVVISSVATVTAMLAGGYSLYIARATKSLTRTQRIFVSYSRDEKDYARALTEALLSRGAKVWIDENELQPGTNLKSSVSSAIEGSNTVVAVLSNYMGAHLKEELRTAVERHVPIYAIIPAGQRVPREFEQMTDRLIHVNTRDDPASVAARVLHYRGQNYAANGEI